MDRHRLQLSCAAIVVLCAAIVVLLGAYTRLTDAGLGCPDWPGCYQQLTVPQTPEAIAAAELAYPDTPVDVAKATSEMVHRYVAGTLSLLLCLLALIALRTKQHRGVSLTLVGLVVFQAALGMWTVTWKLLPLVVMGHLLGGFTILSLSLWLLLSLYKPAPIPTYSAGLPRWIVFALIALAIQIALGGWTSANYAALACPDFPLCHGQLVPDSSWGAFNILRGIGLDNPLTAMSHADRGMIQMIHRLGALITTLILLALCLRLTLEPSATLKRLGSMLLVLLFVQVTLGISNVLLWLPLPIAVAHHGVAALLLLTLVSILYFSLISNKKET